MNDRNLPIIVTGLLAALVIVVVAILIVVSGRDAPTPTPTPSLATPSASATPAGSQSAAPSSNPTPSVEPTPVASSSAAASSSPLPAPLASITFVGLKLDATADPAGLPRTITFRSDGAGTVTAKLASSTPRGTTHMCLQVGAKVIGCNDIAKGTFTGTTKQAHANWQVTLQGTAAAAPIVDLTLTFQSLAPSATIAHARFDGTDFPDTNGIQARFSARAPGDAHLVSSWGGHPFQYEIDLFDETSSSGDATFPAQGPSTNVDQAFPLTAGDWRIVLQNAEGGFGITELTATISWP